MIERYTRKEIKKICEDYNRYSIWLYKGGGNCHHFWLRRIYKTSLRGAKSNIKPIWNKYWIIAKSISSFWYII